MVDLGAWATERYRVPVSEIDESELPGEYDPPKPN
jgi:endogenous inhibitor of DNA gyrase (YacG/DUF329 family)